jgi:hypothetical protein
MIAFRHLVFWCIALLPGLVQDAPANAGVPEPRGRPDVLGEPAAAQAKGSATPSPKSPAETATAILEDPMVFYLAKGEPDMCGPGCSEWIAAEGHVDLDAPQRLRSLIARLGKRRLPIFFHSPGGLQWQGMAIGRLLRERGMTAGVSRTIPAGCVGASDESCRALKRSGQAIAADLQSLAGCHSACVSALIGAKVRQVPPGARLGVHTGRPVRLLPDGHIRMAVQGNPSTEANARIRRYHQEMQIAAGLFEVISKVPFEQAHYLSRDELAGFGIDTREFQESRWMVWETRTVVKFLVEARGTSRKEFRTSFVRLTCATRPGRTRVGYVRAVGSEENGPPRSIKFAVDEQNFLFPQQRSISKIDALDTGATFEARSVDEPLAFFEAAIARGGFDIVEADPTDPSAPVHTIKLSTNGLSKALEEMRGHCTP